MDRYIVYSKEGAIAGASVGAISGAWSALLAPVLYNFLISSIELNFGFLFQYALVSGISGAFSGAVLGIPLALGLMILNKSGVLEEDRISCIKYGVAVSVLLTPLTAFSVFRAVSIDIVPMIAVISLGLLHEVFFLGLWGHWIGESLHSE